MLAGYRPLPGIFDEMMDRDGRVRSHWQRLLAMFATLGSKQLSARFAAADRHVHDSGVFYRVYEETAGTERPWPLSHVPLLIDASEWQGSRPDWSSAPNCRRQLADALRLRRGSCARSLLLGRCI